MNYRRRFLHLKSRVFDRLLMTPFISADLGVLKQLTTPTSAKDVLNLTTTLVVQVRNEET